MPFPSLRGDGALERVGGPKHLLHDITFAIVVPLKAKYTADPV